MTHGPQRWRKSSYSSTGTNCVELASTRNHVRDSKNPTGPTLRADLTSLLIKIKVGHFDR
jgi:hypothetical protein